MRYRFQFLLIFAVLFFAVSCIENQGLSKKRKNASLQQTDEASLVDEKSDEKTVYPVEDAPPKVELRHLVDPIDGTYKTKITMPADFNGLLKLSGLNVTSLRDRLVYVRFKFGREMEDVVLQSAVARASGITPQTDIDVIIVDLSGGEFENIRLLYDLFDYNSYAHGDVPKTDIRDGNLYCRGLKTAYDSTFTPTLEHEKCNYSGAKCLYSYAKIKDSGLYDKNGLTTIPSEAQLDISGGGYMNDLLSNALTKCLPDNNSRDNLERSLSLAGGTISSFGYGVQIPLDGTNYYWKGPFRSQAFSLWEIGDGALFGDFGLFEDSINGSLDPDTGYRSKLFPRSGKLSFQAGVEHLSSTSPFGEGSVKSLLSSGDSDYMDGCNLRAKTPDLSACNVTAEIEIFTYDTSSGAEIKIASSRDIKLQLVKNLTGVSGLKTCSSDSGCGGNECCYNGFCWGKDLVGGICKSDVFGEGNLGVGAVCSSDYQCSSLCCNGLTGRCSPHINREGEQVLCSSPIGSSCVTKEFCQQINVVECYVVKTGVDSVGKQSCALRCYNVPTFGDCKNGVCVTPDTPPVPEFDPENPDCSKAQEPPY
ncbi:MAG: hypothetical protein KAQ98_08185 [Bacteriovoracaceae bacterium]|nr:hypothetical protein [Bacteriovoracaceae bacterium]